MPSNPVDLHERLRSLDQKIAAARARHAAHSDFEDLEIGDLLTGLGEDLEEVTHEDESAAHAAYDEIEARLADAERRLDAKGAPKP